MQESIRPSWSHRRGEPGHVPAYGDDVYTGAGSGAAYTPRRRRPDRIHVQRDGRERRLARDALSPLGERSSVRLRRTSTPTSAAAPEHIANVKLVTVETPDGKLTPDLVRPHLIGFGFEHHVQPRVISVSNVSETGGVYTPDELRSLADLRPRTRDAPARRRRAHLQRRGGARGAASRDRSRTRESMRFRSAAQRTACSQARRSSSSAMRDRRTCRTYASRADSSHRRCASSPRSSWRCSRATCGTNARRTPTRWRLALLEGARRAVSRSRIRSTRTRSSRSCRARSRQRFRSASGSTSGTRSRNEVRWVTSWDTAEEDVDALVAALRAD